MVLTIELSSTGDRSFSVAAPWICNSLRQGRTKNLFRWYFLPSLSFLSYLALSLSALIRFPFRSLSLRREAATLNPGWESAVSSLSGVRGGSSAGRKCIYVVFRAQWTHLIATKIASLLLKVIWKLEKRSVCSLTVTCVLQSIVTCTEYRIEQFFDVSVDAWLLLLVVGVSIVCCVVCSERRQNSFTLQWYCHWQWRDCDYNCCISYSSRLFSSCRSSCLIARCMNIIGDTTLLVTAGRINIALC